MLFGVEETRYCSYSESVVHRVWMVQLDMVKVNCDVGKLYAAGTKANGEVGG
jgi:hypothetical protein